MSTTEDGKLLAQRTWGSSPTGWTAAKAFEPGTKEFFDAALASRRNHEMTWLPGVIPFETMRGKRVLEIGFGPGYDALTFHENGAIYTGIDITPENVERTKKHLAARGYEPNVVQGDAEALQFADASFDVAFSNGVLHHVPDIDKALSEASRVLKPGGEAYVILYNKNSVFYRVTLGLWQHIILGGRRQMSLEDRLRGIEANAAGEKPMVRVYSRAECEAMMRKAGFISVSTKVRKLVWEDLPYLPVVGKLNRFIPHGLLERLGRMAGWYVIVKGRRA